MSKPFFSKSMLRTDPNGNYEAFSGADRVSAYEDRIEIGKLQIPYSDLIELRLFDKVLHIVFATPDGRRNERYFKYDSFLPGKAASSSTTAQPGDGDHGSEPRDLHLFPINIQSSLNQSSQPLVYLPLAGGGYELHIF